MRFIDNRHADTRWETTLVGRERELALTGRLVDALAGSVGGLVEVVGDPGLGKTCLLAAMAAQAAVRGVRVLSASARAHDRTVPFALWHDVADASCPDGTPPAWVHAEVSAVERYRVGRAIRSWIESLARGDGLLLVLDDVHWADESSVEVLGHLLHRAPAGPVLLAVAYRPRQAGAQLSAALAGAAGSAVQADRSRIELAPLPAEEAAKLVGSAVGRTRRQALYSASGGNPFYLLALIRTANAACGRGVDRSAGGAVDTTAGLPSAVREALLAEFAALDPLTRTVAFAVAVAGDDVEPSLAASVAEIAESAALGALDMLAARDLVRVSGGSARFRYRHSLLRQVAYEAAGAGWRVTAHRRAAAALRERGAPVSAYAWHVERYAVAGDGGAVATLVEAARGVLPRAPAQAARWLATALRLSPESSPARLDLLLELAHARGLAGELRAGRDTMRMALDLLPRDQLDRRAMEATFCATLERLLGRHEAARTLLLDELAAMNASTPGTAATARLQLELAMGSFMRADYVANRGFAERALTAGRYHEERAVQATALGFLAMAAFADADVATATSRIDAAAALVDEASDGDLAHRVDGLLWLGWSEIYLERFAAARRHMVRGLRAARSAGHGHLVTLLYAGLATVDRWLGALPSASAAAEDAIDTAMLTNSDELLAIALSVRSWIASWTGEITLALDTAERATRAARQVGGWSAAVAVAMLARARVAAGHPEGCGDLIVDQFGGPDLPVIDPWTRNSWYGVLVRAELARGRLAAAAGWARRAAEVAGRLRLPAHTGLARLAEAQVRSASGRADAAARALQAARAFARAGCRLDEGCARLLAGSHLDDPERAMTELHRARDLFAACAARHLHRAADRELRRRRSRGPRRTRGDRSVGLAALTRRQREVADLVAAGLSNRQIARRLRVSEKTVEMHLTHVFAKLDVAARAAVATAVTRAAPAATRSDQ